ncbi:MAG: hypothetical protein AAF724_04565 [Pseudomonadota bacterium]
MRQLADAELVTQKMDEPFLSYLVRMALFEAEQGLITETEKDPYAANDHRARIAG